MDGAPRAITWEAPQHHHVEKGNDWYFVLAIIVAALVIAAIILENPLIALLFGLAGGALAVAASKRPPIIPYAVTVRGVRIGERLYPHTTLGGYHIDEEDPRGPQLLIRADERFMPLLILPLPPEYIDDIEAILQERLKEEPLEEPLFMKVLELFGF
jgi:hypothetical protein